jgi:hypothetical protein
VGGLNKASHYFRMTHLRVLLVENVSHTHLLRLFSWVVRLLLPFGGSHADVGTPTLFGARTLLHLAGRRRVRMPSRLAPVYPLIVPSNPVCTSGCWRISGSVSGVDSVPPTLALCRRRYPPPRFFSCPILSI